MMAGEIIGDDFDVHQVYPPHAVRDASKLARLAVSMAEDGWQGRPLLGIEIAGCVQLLTGSHRFQSACDAGLSSVPVVLVDSAALEEEGYTLAELNDDDVMISIFRKVGDEAAAELMLAEVNANLAEIDKKEDMTVILENKEVRNI